MPDFRVLTPQHWAVKGRHSTPRGLRSTRRPSSRPPERDAEGRGEVSLCVRLKPGYEEEIAYVEGETVKFKLAEKGLMSFLGDQKSENNDWSVCCDHAFGTQTTQEELYDTAVAPIVDAICHGYNGAVIAYGQTGSGKTYTMVGSKNGPGRGVAARAVAGVFAGLRKASWRIEVSVLEVYNEKVRDLLAPGSTVTTVEVHEVREVSGGLLSFRCPDAITWLARTPEEALAALTEGCRRREVARTDMNHHSSRSHLVFTLNVSQCDREAGATLRSRLHLVDLAGSERLKRSMLDSPRRSVTHRPSLGSPSVTARSPRSCQRREAGEINKSLSQLALVVQRLTASGSQYVPYRDSMLTRLLAESFGGSSKTCLLVCCSPGAEDREETKSSLEFGRRAKMVRNKPTINLEVDSEPSAVMKALMAKELEEMQLDRDALISSREKLLSEISALKEAATSSTRQQEASSLQCSQLEEQLREAQRIARDATDAFSELKEARDEMEARYCREVEEQRVLLQASSQRVVSLLDEEKSERSALAEEASKWQEAHAKANGKLEEQISEARGELQAQLLAVEEAQVSLQRHGHEEATSLARQLVDLKEEITQIQEEKALMAKRAQEDRSALLRHWHEEVMNLREEKVTALSALEADKLSMRRRLQQEITELQQSKDEQVAELEREKANLRDKWQTAMEETGVLQARILATEERFEEALRARTARLVEEKVELQRQCRDELGRLLDEKATEAARLTLESVSLRRRLDQTVAAMEQEKADLVARAEAEKAELQRLLTEAYKEKQCLIEEKAALAEGQAAELLKAQEAWQCAFVKELEECRKLQRAEAVRLQTLVQSMSERHQASEWQTSLLQAELAVLHQHLPAQHLQDRCQIGGASLKGSMEDLHPKRYEGDVTETEPEGEILPGQAFGKLKRSPKMWSPSFKDLNIQTDEEPF